MELFSQRGMLIDTSISSIYQWITGIEGFGEGVGKLERHTIIFPTAGKHQSALDRYDCGFEFTDLNKSKCNHLLVNDS